jgi:hypothetical protein
MAAAALWQPQEEGLREICTLLDAHISPNSDQARIWQQLQHYSQFPDFNNYLVFLLARGEVIHHLLYLFPSPSPTPPSLGFSPMRICDTPASNAAAGLLSI